MLRQCSTTKFHRSHILLSVTFIHFGKRWFLIYTLRLWVQESTYRHTYTYTYIYARTHTHTSTHTHKRTHTHTHTHTYIHTQVCTHTRTQARRQARTHTLTHTKQIESFHLGKCPTQDIIIIIIIIIIYSFLWFVLWEIRSSSDHLSLPPLSHPLHKTDRFSFCHPLLTSFFLLSSSTNILFPFVILY